METCQVRWRGVEIPAAVAVALLVTPAMARADGNHPPTPPGPMSGNWLAAEGTTVRHGKELRFRVQSHDPDGDELSFAVEDLPEGAEFDGELHELSWTPARQAIGTHRIKVRVSDGTATATSVVILHVGENRPPRIEQSARPRVRSGEAVETLFRASDDDGDTLSFEAVRLPRGATVDPRNGRVIWTPSDTQTGAHSLQIRVSDGELDEIAELEVEVVEEWRSKLLPGVYLGTYFPQDDASYGYYRGVVMELVLIAWIRRNENMGPSHGRVYARAQILDSSQADAPATLIYGLGLDLSIERNPRRRWLLPFFGLDVGGIRQDSLGHRYQATPLIGVHLFASRNIQLRAATGYVIVPEELETLSGWQATLGGNFTLW